MGLPETRKDSVRHCATLTGEVREKIERERLIPRGGHAVVGLSGGPDSTCLFDILRKLSGELGYTLSVAHVNHCLRGTESDEDQRYVASLCAETGTPLLVKACDVADIARSRGESVEEAGRNARYEAFAEAAREAATKRGLAPPMIRVALAHNRGDLSETVLMRVIRGTGPDGLTGISAERTGADGYGIVRPLINASREEIEEYCASAGLTPRRDSTNARTDYLRNSVRLELLPILRERYNPSVDDALARLSRAAAESRDYFETLVNDIVKKEGVFFDKNAPAHDKNAPAHDKNAFVHDGDAFVFDKNELARDGSSLTCNGSAFVRDGNAGVRAELPVETLRNAHPAVRHRLIVAMFGRIGLTKDIGAVHLAAADELIASGRTGKGSDFPGGYRLDISYGRAVFSPPCDGTGRPRRGDENSRSFSVAIAGLEQRVGRTILFSDSPAPIEVEILAYDGASASGGPSLVLDYDALSAAAATLHLRTKTDGDRIRLPGMDGSKKLQDIFVDEKIPRAKRDELLLLATDTDVLWIPGLRRARLYEPGPNTKRVVKLTPLA